MRVTFLKEWDDFGAKPLIWYGIVKEVGAS